MSLKRAQFQTGALVYNLAQQQLSSSDIIYADAATPEKYSPDDHHFYCPDCVALGHFTRLVRIKETNKRSPHGFITPAKFDLFKKEHQTHKCNNPVRFRELDNLAERYGAVKLNDSHSYEFPITIHKRNIPEGIRNISRLEKVLAACMYDEELRTRQFFDVGDMRLNLRALFERHAANKSVQNQTYYAAAIFRPVAHAGQRRANTYQREITGYNNTRLSCSDAVYKAVRDMTERKKGNESAPILVFAKAVLNVENLEGHIPFTRYVVDNLKQVTAWNHPVSFDEMISNQAEPPAPYNLALFNPACALKRA